MKEPKVRVGIMSGQEIRFCFHGDYLFGEACFTGEQLVTYSSEGIKWKDKYYSELLFEPSGFTESFFELYEVSIGIGFHWERRENQSFQGALKFIVENGKLLVINLVPLETYLISVISSEMSASASLELLKAHAVISRSWLMNKLKSVNGVLVGKSEKPQFAIQDSQLIKWYDTDDHLLFDVCADDHCQRYQGITRASRPTVTQAVTETAGGGLMYEGEICDARFSKCCGGAFEEFQYCWEDKKHPYLSRQRDSKKCTELPDLRLETEAEKWIKSIPDSFCNTTDQRILRQVLNNYDQETINFYRWKVVYTQDELSELINRRSGIDFGTVEELIPVERGVSGRLVRLKIVGSKRTLTIGKELEIRRILSTSHLYSSAFVIERKGDQFIFYGAGWGHGVGLCQIGAAVMGEQGYNYNEILLHYYIGAMVNKLY